MHPESLATCLSDNASDSSHSRNRLSRPRSCFVESASNSVNSIGNMGFRFIYLWPVREYPSMERAFSPSYVLSRFPEALPQPSMERAFGSVILSAFIFRPHHYKASIFSFRPLHEHDRRNASNQRDAPEPNESQQRFAHGSGKSWVSCNASEEAGHPVHNVPAHDGEPHKSGKDSSGGAAVALPCRSREYSETQCFSWVRWLMQQYLFIVIYSCYRRKLQVRP